MILSIVTGTWNRIDHLRALIESCRKSLPPNWTQGVEYEFCICDGGSTDGTLQYLRDQGITPLEHGELKGAIKAFNDAAAMAKGDYLAILNDDITVLGYTLARGLAYIMDNPDCGAAAFYQDRGGKEWHYESMGVDHDDGTHEAIPYIQCGIVPKWLWDHCGGWGEVSHTYGGDCYLSGKIYEAGYKVVAVEGCKIHDSTPQDELRKINAEIQKKENFWDKFRFKYNKTPQIQNPLKEQKRVLYAPIIDMYQVAKEQKTGLRDALKSQGLVWEVDYVRGGESVVDAAEAWQPHLIVTQFHTKDSISLEHIQRVRMASKGPMINWSGDVWADQATPEMLEILRHYDYHLTVNASLLHKYQAIGIKAAYWQNAAEPPITDNEIAEGATDLIFIANAYTPARVALAEWMKKLPYVVKVYGRDYPEGVSEGESLYNFRRTGQLYRGARLAIADNQYQADKGFFSDRAFMALAAGGCMLLHQRVDGMEELAGLVDGVHYVAWDSFTDLERKIAYYLEHEEERKCIADAGTRECRENHSFSKRVEQLVTLIGGLPRKRRTLSVCAIISTSNAEEYQDFIRRFSFADELVLVNTSFNFIMSDLPKNARVFQFKWIDDFSAARNFAKSKCTGDYILWIDADERLSQSALKNLRNFAAWDFRAKGMHMPQAFRFRVVGMKGEEREPQSCMQLRLFQNIEKLQWAGNVHEHDFLEAGAKELGLSMADMPGMEVIHHLPTDPETIKAKAERDIRLLRKIEPCPWRDAYLGISYAAMERWGDAIIWFGSAFVAVEDKAQKDYLAFNMGLCYHRMDLQDQARIWLGRSKFPDALYLLAVIEHADGRFRADLFHDYLDAPEPQGFPTFALEWRKDAKQRLTEWHTETLEKLTGCSGLAHILPKKVLA